MGVKRFALVWVGVRCGTALCSCHGFGLVGAGGVGSGLGLPELPDHSLGMGFCRGGFYCFDCDVSDDGRQLGGAFGALVCFATGKRRRQDDPGVDLSGVSGAVMFYLFFQRFMESGVGCMAERDGHALCAGVDGFIVACGFFIDHTISGCKRNIDALGNVV